MLQQVFGTDNGKQVRLGIAVQRRDRKTWPPGLTSRAHEAMTLEGSGHVLEHFQAGHGIESASGISSASASTEIFR
jgi:hypothetical protein